MASRATTELTALTKALVRHPPFAGVAETDLVRLPNKGLVHDHVRVTGIALEGRGVLLRVPRGSHWGLTPEASLAYEAACFMRTAPAERTPRLFATLAVEPDVPFGAMVVEEIQGRPPRLPDHMAAIAESLAVVHALPVPTPEDRAPLFSHMDPVAETHARILSQARHLDAIPLSAEARAAIDAELAWAENFAAESANAPHAIALVLTDTHPGNFLVTEAGRAMFVDLEKVLYGSPAIDLAHASLYTSTMWDADCARKLSRDEIRVFYQLYLDAVGPARSEALGPWLAPLRRLTWLRTLTFCAKWFAEARGRGDWPPARLPAQHRDHLADRMADYFAAETIAEVRSEWIGDTLLILP